MKNTLILTTMLAAALLSSGAANAEEGTLYASDYRGGVIMLGTGSACNTLVVNTPLTMTNSTGYIALYDGATFVFQKKQAAEEICSILTSATRTGKWVNTVFFYNSRSVFNFTFDDGAQAVVAASAGTPITLIEDLSTDNKGFSFFNNAGPSDTTLTLNGVESGNPVVLNGVQFTYVGPKASDYTFQEGEIGFTGYEDGSHALKLVANGKPTPEPTTGTLTLLALAGLCARRRRK